MEQASPFVTLDELAKYLNVSHSTVRVWMRKGSIPKHTYIKVGQTYRFNRDQVVNELNAAGPLQTEMDLGEEQEN